MDKNIDIVHGLPLYNGYHIGRSPFSIDLTYTLPVSKDTKSKLLKLDNEQSELYQIIQKNYQGVTTLKTGDFIFPF